VADGGVEIRDVAPGLWIWRQPHPDWRPGAEWSGPVASFAYAARGDVVLVDALAPPDDAREFWERVEREPPTALVVMKPDHVRSVDLFARRFGVRAYGPDVFHRNDVPETELEWVAPGSELPGGAVALYDGRGRNETPLYLAEHRALLCADGLTAPRGELLVWDTPWHEERVLPALRALLELPFERVLVSHGEPVHDRAAFEQALEREPWKG
jgi:glyoxylase-like metal-dependent hydrolase (beta-lactamase superfamily II)